MKIAVIGAGFVGTLIADALVSSGHRVELVGKEPEAVAASNVSFAWLNSHRKRPDAYQRLNQLGLKFWKDDFSRRFPEHVHWGGHTVAVSEPTHVEALLERVDYLQRLGYPAHVAARGAVEVRGSLNIGEAECVAYFPSEGHCDHREIRRELLDSLADSGRCNRVDAYVDRVTDQGLRLENGEQLTADRVVVAAGAGTPRLTAQLGREVPMVEQSFPGAAWGYLAEATLDNHDLAEVVSTDYLNARPVGGNRLLLQALDLDREISSQEEPEEHVRAEFLKRAQRLFQRTDVRIERVSVGHRVIPRDGQTVAGPLFGGALDSTWCVMTHSGITLGPWLAQEIVREMCDGELGGALAEFRATRFHEGNKFVQVHAATVPGEQ